MTDQTSRLLTTLIIFLAVVAPLATMTAILVWPPKRRSTVICLRGLATLVVLVWPVSFFCIPFLSPHNPAFICVIVANVADAAPLIFVLIRSAILYKTAFEWLNKRKYLIPVFVFVVFT